MLGLQLALGKMHSLNLINLKIYLFCSRGVSCCTFQYEQTQTASYEFAICLNANYLPFSGCGQFLHKKEWFAKGT